LSDEEFARMANDAEWLHEQGQMFKQANALGAIAK